jgi:hypothetical protein
MDGQVPGKLGGQLAMMITIVDGTSNAFKDRAQLFNVLRAITRQVYYDFKPYWGLATKLRLTTARGPDFTPSEPIGSDATIVLCRLSDYRESQGMSEDDGEGFYGFHDMDPKRRMPVGYVIVDDGRGRVGRNWDWSLWLSHEVLELIANPLVNLWIRGPHPHPDMAKEGKRAFIMREVCDAVQNQSYRIDGVLVSNFVLPLYFREDLYSPGDRVDFLITPDLKPFGITEGGYLPFMEAPSSPAEPTVQYEKFNGRNYRTSPLVARLPLAAGRIVRRARGRRRPGRSN